jgi:hypothetical protein
LRNRHCKLAPKKAKEKNGNFATKIISMDLSKIYIYRIIHIENIPHILQYGITHKNSPNANNNYVSIGDESLIRTREKKLVTITNGDHACSIETIILGDFIPFYFGIRMPMLYVSKSGGNCVSRATPSENIIYVVCNVEELTQSGIRYYFSDGHASDFQTSFYNDIKINDLPEIIKWEAVRARYWGGEENLELKTKKQAEFLAGNDICVQYLKGFMCYNSDVKSRLLEMGISENKIKVKPEAYY